MGKDPITQKAQPTRPRKQPIRLKRSNWDLIRVQVISQITRVCQPSFKQCVQQKLIIRGAFSPCFTKGRNP